jgi:hypothetical protein
VFCPRCGEENAGNVHYCRQCGGRLPDAVTGYPPAPPQELPAAPPSNALAVTGLVLSCVGFFMCGLLSIVGLVLGIVALGRAKREPLRYSGEGLAIASIAVGIVAAIKLAVGVAIAVSMLTGAPMAFMQGKGPFAQQMQAAQTQGARSMDASNLYTIGLSVATYRKDHAGQYPPTLDALVDGGYLAAGTVVPVAEDFTQVPAGGDGLGQYSLVGNLPGQIPEHTAIAYTRPGVLSGGRSILFANMVVQWHPEAALTGPSGILAQSYARLVEALGDQLAEERKAELREFYEIEDVREE